MDYNLSAKIPQELIVEVQKMVEEVNEAFPAAQANISSVTRQALADSVRRSLFGQNKIVPVELPIKDLNKSELETVSHGLSLIASVIPSVEPAHDKIYLELGRIEDKEILEKYKRGEV